MSNTIMYTTNERILKTYINIILFAGIILYEYKKYQIFYTT